MSRHPELRKELLSPDVSYACAYLRLNLGWSLKDAVSTPPRRRGDAGRNRKRGALMPPTPAEASAAARWRVPPWERPGYVAIKPAKRILTPRIGREPHPVIRKRHVNSAEDTSPAHIRRLRAAYCNQFIKTGVLDESMAAQLRTYANERRAVIKNSSRVPDEHAGVHHGRKGSPAIDDDSRDVAQAGRVQT